MDRAIRQAFLLGVALLVLAPRPAGATQQFPENLIYKGKTLLLFSEPLERYFSQGSATYWDEPANGSSGRRPAVFRASSTACYRGYEGTWKIAEGRLWLVSLRKCWAGKHVQEEIPLSAVFPGKKAPLEAGWYTGVLRAAFGNRLPRAQIQIGSWRYQQRLELAIRNGKVEGELILDNRPGVPMQSGFLEQLSDTDLAQGLMTAARTLARCARLGKKKAGPVDVEILSEGTVSSIKLGGTLPGTPAGRCLFGALAGARYPRFFGPAVRTTYHLP